MEVRFYKYKLDPADFEPIMIVLADDRDGFQAWLDESTTSCHSHRDPEELPAPDVDLRHRELWWWFYLKFDDFSEFNVLGDTWWPPKPHPRNSDPNWQGHIVSRASPRVFYFLDDTYCPTATYKEWCRDVQDTYRYGDDYRLEWMSWPATPPTVRLVFVREEDADAMVAKWKDRVNFHDTPRNDLYRNDPDYVHGRPAEKN